MQYFNGREQALKLDKKISAYLKKHPTRDILAIVQIGYDRTSDNFVRLKEKYCEKLGLTCRAYRMEDNLSIPYIFHNIEMICKDEEVGGVVIQLPLPRVELKKCLNFIPLEKDIDLLSSKSLDQYYVNTSKLLPPAVGALRYFLQTNKLNLTNKRCVVIGHGFLVGKPVSHYLKTLGAKVEVLENYKTGEKLDCDLLVLSAGVPRLVKGEDIKRGSVVDFGSSMVNGKLVGDLDLDSKLDHLDIISPSPGGMGPLTIRFLISNFLRYPIV